MNYLGPALYTVLTDLLWFRTDTYLTHAQEGDRGVTQIRGPWDRFYGMSLRLRHRPL
jgi:hypothetical protein